MRNINIITRRIYKKNFEGMVYENPKKQIKEIEINDVVEITFNDKKDMWKVIKSDDMDFTVQNKNYKMQLPFNKKTKKSIYKGAKIISIFSPILNLQDEDSKNILQSGVSVGLKYLLVCGVFKYLK